MIHEDRRNPELRTCPECGSRLAIEEREFDGAKITIAICRGYPDCNYFWWMPSNGGGHGSGPSFDALTNWAIRESLSVLRRSRPKNRYEPLRGLFSNFGGDGGG